MILSKGGEEPIVSILEAQALDHIADQAAPAHGGLRSALETTGLVVAPVTLLTALLYYFGWASSNAAWMYFGVDQSAIGFSVQDYILRAVRPLFWPLSVLVLVGLLAVEADAEVDRMLQVGLHRSALRRLPLLLASVGGLFLAVALLRRQGYLVFGYHPVLTPALFSLGTAGLSYGAQLRRQILEAEQGSRSQDRSHRSKSRGSLTFSLAWVLLLLGVFWTLGNWASVEGWHSAQELSRNLASQPGVVIHSKEALAIDGPGVHLDVSTEPNAAYHYTYTGLRLLVRSAGRFFLVPDGWTPHAAAAVVVPESDGMRVDYTTP